MYLINEFNLQSQPYVVYKVCSSTLDAANSIFEINRSTDLMYIYIDDRQEVSVK